MFTINVKFEGTAQTYSYGSFDSTIVAGDQVIVNTPTRGLTFVRVVSVTPGMLPSVTKLVLGKIDEKQVAVDAARLEKYKQLNHKLQAKLAAFKEREVYQILAQSDPEAADILSQLKSI